jgi:hypothetical protein
MTIVINAECHYAECRYAKCHYSVCRSAFISGALYNERNMYKIPICVLPPREAKASTE